MLCKVMMALLLHCDNVRPIKYNDPHTVLGMRYLAHTVLGMRYLAHVCLRYEVSSSYLSSVRRQFGTVVRAVGREAGVSQLHGFNSRSR